MLLKRYGTLVHALAVTLLLAGCPATTKQDRRGAGSNAPVVTRDASGRLASDVDAAPETRAEQVGAENAPETTNLTLVERRFLEGMDQYNEGHFPNAIRVFKDPMFDRAWPELRARALKYLAFSYCVSNNTAQCRKTFADLLKLNPEFELTSAERGHPVWGPAFRQVKAESAQTPK